MLSIQMKKTVTTNNHLMSMPPYCREKYTELCLRKSKREGDMCSSHLDIERIYSQLSRCSTARGLITWLCLVGPIKVKGCKFYM